MISELVKQCIQPFIYCVSELFLFGIALNSISDIILLIAFETIATLQLRSF
jgi:hypothetical protein